MQGDNNSSNTSQLLLTSLSLFLVFNCATRTVLGRPFVCPVLSVCNVDILWPNGCVDQDETWHGGRPRPRPLCVRWGPSPPKKGTAPNFRPMSVVPNGYMNQDVTWYGGRPRPRPHCVRWGPSSPTRKLHSSPLFSADVYCGQTVAHLGLD